MKAVEPGTKYEVEYAEGKKLQCVSLSLRGKIKLMELMEIVTSTDESIKGSQRIQSIVDALSLVSPGLTEDQLDTFDDVLAMEAIKAAMAGNSVSRDDEKKSE